MFLTPRELQQELKQRNVDRREVDRVQALLSAPDPAGVIPSEAARRERIEHVAVYQHFPVQQGFFPSPAWHALEAGHPAARAIYWHEYQELESYRLMGVQQPLEVHEDGDEYWRAHARASWEEAKYWEAWAQAEGRSISAQAFLRGHPMRQQELQDLLDELRDHWGVDVSVVTRVESDEAARFYRSKRLSDAEIRQWRLPRGSDRSYSAARTARERRSISPKRKTAPPTSETTSSATQ